MIQLNYIRQNPEEVIKRLAIRGRDDSSSVQQVLALDNDRRALIVESEQAQNRANVIAKEIGELFKSGNQARAQVLKEESAELKERIKTLSEKASELNESIQNIMLSLPNTPSFDVPLGKTPEDNITVVSHGTPPVLGNFAVPHWDLTERYDLIDFELGVKIAGSGFPVYKGKGARLQRALINFFLDEALKEGYNEVQPPIFVNEESGYATGQLPDKEGQMYHMQIDNLFCIPTAEVPITNMYRDVILREEDLPLKNVGYTPCFRREAGSYGKDVRGLNRLHQFDKVEVVQITHPSKSYETLETMQKYVQGLLQKLELPYRVLKLCGGDMGFTSALTYDLEVYSAAQQRWLEVSSVSNFETFQSNRLKCRFKNKEGKTELCHTLNGSALALPRIVAALLENNQTENGIKIPAILHTYTGFTEIS